MLKPRMRLLVAIFLSLVILVAGQYGLRKAYDPRRGNPDNGVIILTTDWCPYCKSLRLYLQAMHIPYQDYDIEDGWAGFWRHRATRARGVPVTLVGDRLVYGYDLEGINAALREAGYSLPD